MKQCWNDLFSLKTKTTGLINGKKILQWRMKKIWWCVNLQCGRFQCRTSFEIKNISRLGKFSCWRSTTLIQLTFKAHFDLNQVLSRCRRRRDIKNSLWPKKASDWKLRKRKFNPENFVFKSFVKNLWGLYSLRKVKFVR